MAQTSSKKSRTASRSKQPDPQQELKDIVNRGMYPPNSFSERLLNATFPDWLPDRLRKQAVDVLRQLSTTSLHYY